MTINWPVVLPIIVSSATALNTVLAVVVAKWSAAPKWVRVLQAGLADIIPLLPGVPGSQTIKAVRIPAPPAVLPLAALLLFLPLLGGCAELSWTTPVFFAGPSVAPIEEVSKKNPSPAIASGFQETIGLGQFEFEEHEWDAIDLSALELGGLILNGAGPAGALQLGGEIGTLNGIIGLGILATPYTANGGGFLQGGNPGVTWAGVLNVSAIAAYFETEASKAKLKDKPRLPRGGL